MSPSKLLFATFLLLAAVNANLVTLRATDWNAVDIYSVDQSTGIIQDQATWPIDLPPTYWTFASSPNGKTLAFLDMTNQDLTAGFIDAATGAILKYGDVNTGTAPYNCGGLVYKSDSEIIFSCTYGGGLEVYALNPSSLATKSVFYLNTQSAPTFGALNPNDATTYVMTVRDSKNQWLESDHVMILNLNAQTSMYCTAPFKNSTISQPIWTSDIPLTFLIQHPDTHFGSVTNLVQLDAKTCKWSEPLASFTDVPMVASTVQVDASHPTTLLWLSPQGVLYSHDVNSGANSGVVLIEQGTNKIYPFNALLQLP